LVINLSGRVKFKAPSISKSPDKPIKDLTNFLIDARRLAVTITQNIQSIWRFGSLYLQGN